MSSSGSPQPDVSSAGPARRRGERVPPDETRSAPASPSAGAAVRMRDPELVAATDSRTLGVRWNISSSRSAFPTDRSGTAAARRWLGGGHGLTLAVASSPSASGAVRWWGWRGWRVCSVGLLREVSASDGSNQLGPATIEAFTRAGCRCCRATDRTRPRRRLLWQLSMRNPRSTASRSPLYTKLHNRVLRPYDGHHRTASTPTATSPPYTPSTSTSTPSLPKHGSNSGLPET